MAKDLNVKNRKTVAASFGAFLFSFDFILQLWNLIRANGINNNYKKKKQRIEKVFI